MEKPWNASAMILCHQDGKWKEYREKEREREESDSIM